VDIFSPYFVDKKFLFTHLIEEIEECSESDEPSISPLYIRFALGNPCDPSD